MIAELQPYRQTRDSGVAWLGEVPAHWDLLPPKRRLRSESSGGSIIKNTASNEPRQGYVPAFSASGQDVWLPVASHHGSALVLSAVGARCGKTFKACGDWAVVANTHVLRPGANQSRDFWWYVTNSQDWWDRAGAAQPFVRVSATLNRTWAIPPLAEQASIVRYLDHVDRRVRRLVRAKRKLIALLTEQRRRAVRNAIESRGTTTNRLETVVDLVRRPIDRKDEHAYTPIGLYNRGRGIFIKDARKGSELGDSNFFWIEEGDLVISGQFAWEGAIALAGGVAAGCVASHRYPIVRGRPEALDTTYLLAFFQTDWGQLLLDHHSRGAAGRNRPLNARTLLKEKISLPPLSTQRRIAEMVELEFRVRRNVDDWVLALTEYRTRFIADVVTGKLDVREAAAHLPDDPVEDEGPDGTAALTEPDDAPAEDTDAVAEEEEA